MSEDPNDPKNDPKWDPELKEKLEKKNAEARNLRERLKEAEAKASKLDELEAAQKSELERAQEAARVAQERAEKAERASLRAEIAAEKGLSLKAAKRLTGATREEMEADADELAELLGPSKPDGDDEDPNDGGKPPTIGGGRPVEDLQTGGVDPSDQPVEMNPAKLAESVGDGF